MPKTARPSARREDSLSRDRIIEAAIELLDASGEEGLTFRALSERLATGAGAIYWHVANKSDLLTAAGDALVARTLAACAPDATPKAALRALALGLFDAIDAHPWVGSALMHSPGQMPMVRILEHIGTQVRAIGVPPDEQWAAASALLHYILGVGGQNAANRLYAQANKLDRDDFLATVSAQWSALDADAWPFTRSVAAQLGEHDDRADFLAGIDLILGGLKGRRAR
jgi:AcrR family transcriptional regulator